MGPGEHRPHDHEYWTQPWSTTLFAGDLFEAIPFGDQPTVLYTGEQEPVAAKHFVGEVAFGYGLLITPTCDMTDQHGGGGPAHPYRVLVPVLPLALVAEQTGAVAENEMLLRSRDMIHPYMYLPPLPGVLDDESVACLFRPSLVSDALLTDPPRRIAQLQAPARRHLKSSSRLTGLASPSIPPSCRCTNATRRTSAQRLGRRAGTTIPKRLYSPRPSSSRGALPCPRKAVGKTRGARVV